MSAKPKTPTNRPTNRVKTEHLEKLAEELLNSVRESCRAALTIPQSISLPEYEESLRQHQSYLRSRIVEAKENLTTAKQRQGKTVRSVAITYGGSGLLDIFHRANEMRMDALAQVYNGKTLPASFTEDKLQELFAPKPEK